MAQQCYTCMQEDRKVRALSDTFHMDREGVPPVVVARREDQVHGAPAGDARCEGSLEGCPDHLVHTLSPPDSNASCPRNIRRWYRGICCAYSMF